MLELRTMLAGLGRKLPLLLAIATQLSACDNAPPKPPDPRMEVLNSRAHSIIDKINSSEDVGRNAYKDVSDVMCPGISKMWLPSVAGDIGDVTFITVPGSTIPPAINASDFPPEPPERIPTYQIALAFKNVDFFTPVDIMVIFDPKTGTCSADVWTSGP